MEGFRTRVRFPPPPLFVISGPWVRASRLAYLAIVAVRLRRTNQVASKSDWPASSTTTSSPSSTTWSAPSRRTLSTTSGRRSLHETTAAHAHLDGRAVLPDQPCVERLAENLGQREPGGLGCSPERRGRLLWKTERRALRQVSHRRVSSVLGWRRPPSTDPRGRPPLRHHLRRRHGRKPSEATTHAASRTPPQVTQATDVF